MFHDYWAIFRLCGIRDARAILGFVMVYFSLFRCSIYFTLMSLTKIQQAGHCAPTHVCLPTMVVLLTRKNKVKDEGENPSSLIVVHDFEIEYFFSFLHARSAFHNYHHFLNFTEDVKNFVYWSCFMTPGNISVQRYSRRARYPMLSDPIVCCSLIFSWFILPFSMQDLSVLDNKQTAGEWLSH